jgi:terminase large subunit-like protein
MLSKKAFFQAVGYRPHKGQIQIHGALGMPGVRTVVAICGTRFGKTMAAAHEMAYEAVRPRSPTEINPNGDFMGWAVGPDHDKANLVFDACVQILRGYLKGHIAVNKTDGLIEFTNLSGGRSRIMRRTAADAGGKGKLVGYAVDFMVIDEAAKIAHADIWENQLSGRLVDRQGSSLHISSPMGVNGYCAALYRTGQSGRDKRVVSMKLPTWLNPYIKKDELQYARRTLPRKVFDAEFGAEMLVDGGVVFSKEDLDAICILDGFEPPHPAGDYFGGLDLAMTNDHTVLSIWRAPWANQRRPRLVHVERFYKLPIEIQLDRIKATQARYNDCPLNVDESGIGKPIMEMMRNKDMNVRGVVTSHQGDTSKHAQLVNACALVERRAVLMPRRELLPVYVEEMELYQFGERTSLGKLTAAAPPGAHDDCVASFLLSSWWIRAGGTAGTDQTYRSGDRPKPEGPKRPEMKVEGLARPDADEEGGVWTAPTGRHAKLWGNKLFGRGRSW